MKTKLPRFLALLWISFTALLLFAGCGGGGNGGGLMWGKRGGDKEVERNVKALMGLAIGMTKEEVQRLAGTANFVEGYDWGSVWFYKTVTGGGVNDVLDARTERLYTPVVFNTTNRVIGYGTKFYEQTLQDLGTGQF